MITNDVLYHTAWQLIVKSTGGPVLPGHDISDQATAPHLAQWE